MPELSSLILEPRPSRSLLIGGGIAHVAAGFAVIFSSIPIWVKIGFIAALGLSLASMGFNSGSRHGRGFIARIELLDGRWRLETGSGATHRADLIGGYAHPAIVILNFRLESGRRRSLTLLPDSVDPDALRRLRVWLRISRDTDATDPRR